MIVSVRQEGMLEFGQKASVVRMIVGTVTVMIAVAVMIVVTVVLAFAVFVGMVVMAVFVVTVMIVVAVVFVLITVLAVAVFMVVFHGAAFFQIVRNQVDCGNDNYIVTLQITVSII